LRDYVGQGLGRIAGAGVYCMLALPNDLGLRITAGVAGTVIGGQLAYRLAEAQIGNDTGYQKAGVALCTVLGAVAGGSISAIGSNQVISGIGTFAVLAAGASLTKRCADSPDARRRAEMIKLGAATLGLTAGIATASADPVWMVANRLLPSRNLGLLVESTVIEMAKSSFERLGPSVDRHALNFEGRVVAALAGMAPYVTVTVLLNGYVAGRLQPGYDSNHIEDLIAPALVGAIANAVRGASNALAVSLLHRQQRFVVDGRSCLREGLGPRLPKARAVSDKTCVRYFLSACRNGVYARLRDANFSVTDANMMAQSAYACFAQCRDLIADLIRGDGWSEPKLQTRTALPEPPPVEGQESESVIV
jgi:hypothetical protein